LRRVRCSLVVQRLSSLTYFRVSLKTIFFSLRIDQRSNTFHVATL
jgi:hypothetical protein